PPRTPHQDEPEHDGGRGYEGRGATVEAGGGQVVVTLRRRDVRARGVGPRGVVVRVDGGRRRDVRQRLARQVGGHDLVRRGARHLLAGEQAHVLGAGHGGERAAPGEVLLLDGRV